MKKVSITKKISITTIGLIAMLMLLAAPMYAGTASAMEHGDAKAKDSKKGKMASADESSRQDAIQASYLMDREVQDAEGDKIGSVTDMIIGADGNVEYIVLSQGDSILDLGEKDLLPVPWSKVEIGNIGEDEEALTLSLSKQELEDAPSFNEEEWQAFLKGEKQQEVRGYYGTEDDRPSGHDQMKEEKSGESHEMKKKKTEGKDGEDKY